MSNIVGPYNSDESVELMMISRFLQKKKFTHVKESHQMNRDYPESNDIKIFAGFLYIPLSKKEGYFVAFIRRQRARSIKWAGDPIEKIRDEEEAIIVLEPRFLF